MQKDRSDDGILWKAVASGFIGAVAVTLVNETARRFIADAPHLETLGRQAVAKVYDAVGEPRPPEAQLQKMALVGDIALNTAYYSLVNLAGRQSGAAGAALGVLGGAMATALPKPMGLSNRPSARTPQTALMTYAWYAIGGLAAGLSQRIFQRL